MANWILERSRVACCPWPAQCKCRPRAEARAPQALDLDLGASGESWETVLSDLLAAAGR